MRVLLAVADRPRETNSSTTSNSNSSNGKNTGPSTTTSEERGTPTTATTSLELLLDEAKSAQQRVEIGTLFESDDTDIDPNSEQHTLLAPPQEPRTLSLTPSPLRILEEKEVPVEELEDLPQENKARPIVSSASNQSGDSGVDLIAPEEQEERKPFAKQQFESDKQQEGDHTTTFHCCSGATTQALVDKRETSWEQLVVPTATLKQQPEPTKTVTQATRSALAIEVDDRRALALPIDCICKQEPVESASPSFCRVSHLSSSTATTVRTPPSQPPASAVFQTSTTLEPICCEFTSISTAGTTVHSTAFGLFVPSTLPASSGLAVDSNTYNTCRLDHSEIADPSLRATRTPPSPSSPLLLQQRPKKRQAFEPITQAAAKKSNSLSDSIFSIDDALDQLSTASSVVFSPHSISAVPPEVALTAFVATQPAPLDSKPAAKDYPIREISSRNMAVGGRGSNGNNNDDDDDYPDDIYNDPSRVLAHHHPAENEPPTTLFPNHYPLVPPIAISLRNNHDVDPASDEERELPEMSPTSTEQGAVAADHLKDKESSANDNSDEGGILEQFTDALKKHGLEIVPQDGDGNCLFRAVSLQVYGSSDNHGEVRERCMDFMARNEEHYSDFVAVGNSETDADAIPVARAASAFQDYVARKRINGVHGNHAEIQAMSELFNRPIEVYTPPSFDLQSSSETSGSAPVLQPMNFHAEYKTTDPPIRLSFHDGNHYNAVVDPLVPTAGLGLGLPGLKPGLADQMQVTRAKTESDQIADEVELQRVLKESREEKDDELQRVLKESSVDFVSMTCRTTGIQLLSNAVFSLH